ncbi:MAG: hypothetical protein WCY11_03635 [Novosphingobium sp.]
MRKIILALAMLVASSAQADVIYRWEPATPPPTGIAAGLRITDEAWRSGRIQWDSRDYPGPSHPDAPVVSGIMMLEYPGYPGGEWQNAPLEGYYDFTAWFDLTLVGNGIAGSMYMRWGEEGSSEGSGTLGNWTFDIRNVAAGGSENPCFAQVEGEVGCIVSGRWVLDRSTIPVPLPGTLALMSLGLVIARRRQTSPQERCAN